MGVVKFAGDALQPGDVTWKAADPDSLKRRMRWEKAAMFALLLLRWYDLSEIIYVLVPFETENKWIGKATLICCHLMSSQSMSGDKETTGGVVFDVNCQWQARQTGLMPVEAARESTDMEIKYSRRETRKLENQTTTLFLLFLVHRSFFLSFHFSLSASPPHR